MCTDVTPNTAVMFHSKY